MERSLDLAVAGKRCRIHRNDRVARSLEEGAHLIQLQTHTNCNWDGGEGPSASASGSEPLLVDRHDARTLLDEMALQSLCDGTSERASAGGASQPLEEEGTKEEIEARNFERYGMLPEYSACFAGSKSKKRSRWGEKLGRSKKSDGDGGDVEGACEDEGKEPESAKEEAFQLSEEQLRGLPAGIALPKTARQNTIMEHTVSRLASNPQLEILLKVKQGANADFSFLHPSDELHAYYLHLKEKHGNNSKDENCSKKSSDDDAPDNPLSGLLGGYASSSDESGSPAKEVAAQPNGKSTDDDNKTGGKEDAQADDQSSEQDKKRKAERMERLRAWKESRLKQN